jgi:hypothetical protein
MLYIYQTVSSLRVVWGDHKPAACFEHIAPRIYSDASRAFGVETDPRVRSAIVLIDPSAAKQRGIAVHHRAAREVNRQSSNYERGYVDAREGRPMMPVHFFGPNGTAEDYAAGYEAWNTTQGRKS